jgi:RecA/RadA recombinase
MIKVYEEFEKAVLALGQVKPLDPTIPQSYISTGSSLLDLYMGDREVYAGWPLGRFLEISGSDGAGKSTLATEAMASVTQGRGTVVSLKDNGAGIFSREVEKDHIPPGYVFLVDTEYKWDLNRAARMGVNLSRVFHITPEKLKFSKGAGKKKTAEMTDSSFLTLQMVVSEVEAIFKMITENKEMRDVPVLIVWDSLAATPNEDEITIGGLHAGGIASKARVIRSVMRRMSAQLSHYRVSMLICNQVYDRINVPGYETSGGRGLRYHASFRMRLTPVPGGFGGATTRLGIWTKVTPLKSSFCSPDFFFQLPLRFKDGIDDETSVVSHFIDNPKLEGNPVKVKTPWIYIEAPHLKKPVAIQGINGVQKAVRADADLRSFLRESLWYVMQQD